ncbi:MAG: hypothetical protein LBN24_03135 [Mediterranea sp.]|jgi:DNA-directed RNA polymerase subunit RPC12/RpoP|nr:hypothetical protein [Mediterranea sp.]
MSENKEPFDRSRYIKLLTERGANLPCPRCGHNHFTIVAGYTYYPVTEAKGEIVLGGTTTVPAILVICSKCGAIFPHALGTFESLNNEKDNDKNQKESKEQGL